MEKIKRILLKNKKITRIAVLVKRYCVRLIMLCFRVKPLQKNKVVFISFSGRGFGDNGKGIALKLKEKRGREESGLFMIEGLRSVRDAYQKGAKFEYVFSTELNVIGFNCSTFAVCCV